LVTGGGAGTGVGVVPVLVDGAVVPPLLSVAEGVGAEPDVPELPAAVVLLGAAFCNDAAFVPVTPPQPHATAITKSAKKKRIA
jgi:hypothetical protein